MNRFYNFHIGGQIGSGIFLEFSNENPSQE